MDRIAQRKQADEIATRLDAGETVNALATEYGLSRITIWRRANQGIGARFPSMDDRDQSREETTAILWRNIMAADQAGDRKELVTLLDRYSRMNGLDHTHRVQEAQLHLDAARVRLLAERMGEALDAANIPVEQRRAVLEALTDE